MNLRVGRHFRRGAYLIGNNFATPIILLTTEISYCSSYMYTGCETVKICSYNFYFIRKKIEIFSLVSI